MKKTVTTVLMLLTVALLVQAVGFAWLSDNGLSSPINITSNVHKTYFAGGDGSATDPYVIATPAQLYYFAWLQYLGYFNLDEKGDDGKIDSTFYFVLGNDIDMHAVDDEGNALNYVLPPIGTTDNPFIGNFDGCGYTVSNATVENKYSSLIEPPDETTEENFGGVEIIGFFGMVGALPADADKYDDEIKTANEVKNLVLKNLTVRTQTEKSLIGLVAGYVNGLVDGVGVVGGTVNIENGVEALSYTANISDFSLIGYCEEGFKDSMYFMDVMLSEPTSSGDPYIVIPDMSDGGEGNGWGGSVAMKDILTWLKDMNDNGSPSYDYVTARTDKVMLDGTHHTIPSSIETTGVDAATVENFGSFVFADFTAGSDYNFMGGSTRVKECKYEYSGTTEATYVITDGTNYIGRSGTNIVNVTSADAAEKWFVKVEDGGSAIYTVIGSDVYYLTMENGRPALTADVTPDAPPLWDNTGDGLSFDSQKLKFVDEAWQVERKLYYISNGTATDSNHLTVDGTSIDNVDNRGNAVAWELDISSGTTTISTVVENQNGTRTTYYLGASGSGLTLTTTPTTWTYSSSNRRFSVRSGNRTYYLRYNSGWTTTTSSRYATQITLTEAEVADEGGADARVESEGTAEGITCTVTEFIESLDENYYYENGVKQPTNNTVPGFTYFPLTSDVTLTYDDNDRVTGRSYAVSGNNTGYIVSSRYGDLEKGESDQYGNIRISRYDATQYLEDPETHYTITYKSGGVQPLTNSTTEANAASYGLQKYMNSRNTFLTSLKDNTDDYVSCYGLHFMRASVTKSNVVTIDAWLRGELVEDYQVPLNCIDFHLYERGYINFYAGSYYTLETIHNNSCFSIYEIKREGKEITDILEISRIFAVLDENDNIDTSKPYLYTYTTYTTAANGTVTKNEVGLEDIPTSEDLPLNERYQEVFDCAWITDSASSLGSAWDDDRLYYFEVPVNDGEYAIGSTYNKTGAYLLYLDLAANAQIIERTQEYEEITEADKVGTFPKGVELLEEAGEGESYDTSDINPQDSAFASIGGSTSGEITFEREDDTVTHSATGGTTATHIGIDATLENASGKMSLPISSETVIRRWTYRDTNITTGATTVTVITEFTETEGGATKVEYTKKVIKTVVNQDGTTTVTENESDRTSTKPKPENEGEPETALKGGAELLKLSFAYGVAESLDVTYEESLGVTYEFIPAAQDENGNPTAATYLVTVDNQSGEAVEIRATLTTAGAGSDITFIIVAGEKSTTLVKTTDVQSITVSAQS